MCCCLALPSYLDWAGLGLRYYKGLGTSTAKEAKVRSVAFLQFSEASETLMGRKELLVILES